VHKLLWYQTWIKQPLTHSRLFTIKTHDSFSKFVDHEAIFWIMKLCR